MHLELKGPMWLEFELTCVPMTAAYIVFLWSFGHEYSQSARGTCMDIEHAFSIHLRPLQKRGHKLFFSWSN